MGQSGGGEGGTAPSCDDAKSPSDEVCLVSDDYAVFVSPGGVDTSDGTKSAPVKTLTKALKLARDASKIVIACASSGPFTETLNITATLDGARLYGGFDCDTWEYTR
jgi:hypothetical protein